MLNRTMINILIVDDDDDIRYLYEKSLSFLGYKIYATARNGEEAVKIYEASSNKPDIIIMDYHMPVKNGLDATKEILKIDENARVLIISGDNYIKEEALKIGATGFCQKPISFRVFSNTIKALYEEITQSGLLLC